MVLPALMIVVTLLLLCWQVILWVGWLRIRKAEQCTAATTNLLPVTLIIVARNEGAFLPQLLESVRKQDHPEFDCLVVLDRCTDNSLEVLQQVSEGDVRFRWIVQEAPEFPDSPKKSGLLLGIRQARYPNLVFTDADCILPNGFLTCFARAFSAGHQVILGSGMYAANSGLLNLWIQFETIHTAATYHALNGIGRPYMGVGRSIGYTRAAFEAIGGFGDGMAIRSGDDDLLVQRFRGRFRMHSLTHPEASSLSVRIPSTLQEYYQQKTRHISVSKYYPLHVKLLLGLVPLFNLAFYTHVIWSIAGGWGNIELILLCTIWLVRWPFWTMVAHRFGRIQVSAWFPLLEVLNVVYYPLMLPATWTKKIRWK